MASESVDCFKGDLAKPRAECKNFKRMGWNDIDKLAPTLADLVTGFGIEMKGQAGPDPIYLSKA